MGWDGYHPQLGPWRQNFNPPTPCGVGLHSCRITATTVPISIHPPRVGWDSRRSQRPNIQRISIHPPRVGWDLRFWPQRMWAFYFNPPTPCGVGLLPGVRHDIGDDFNPPTPCGVGRRLLGKRPGEIAFQSTHPVWGGTRARRLRHQPHRYFNPPTPCGVGQAH